MICPICKKKFYDHPAISRKDNKTKICSDCGIREAIQAFTKDKVKQKELLDAIFTYQKRARELSIEIDVYIDPDDPSKVIKLNKM